MAFRFYRNVLEILLLCLINSSVFCNDFAIIRTVEVINENSFTDKNSTYVRATLLLNGSNFHKNMKIKLTPEKNVKADHCIDDDDNNHLGNFDSEFSPSNSTFLSFNVSFAYNFDSPFTDYSLCVLNNLPNSDNDSNYVKWLYSGKSVPFRTRRLNADRVDDFSNDVFPPKS